MVGLGRTDLYRYSSFVESHNEDALLPYAEVKDNKSNLSKDDCFGQIKDLTEVMSARLEAATNNNDEEQKFDSTIEDDKKDLLLDDLDEDDDIEQVKIGDMLLTDDIASPLLGKDGVDLEDDNLLDDKDELAGNTELGMRTTADTMFRGTV